MANPIISFEMKVFWSVILVIESVLIITGNIMAIIVFLKKNFAVARSSYMLVNLTIADVLVGVAVFLTFLELTFSSQYMFSACIGETVNRVAQSVSLFTMFASLVSMALTALERMLAILWPFRFRKIHGLHYAVAVAVSWCLSIPLVFQRLVNDCSDMKARIVTNRLVLILQAMAIIIIILSYAAIFVKVRFFPEFQSSSSMKKNIRLAKTLMMTAAIAILTWMPRFAGKIFKVVSSSLRDIDVYLTLLVIIYSNSFLNLLVYAWRIPNFSKEIKKLLKCGCISSNDVVPVTSSLSTQSGQPTSQKETPESDCTGKDLPAKTGSTAGSSENNKMPKLERGISFNPELITVHC
ncbi:trace amine-associated receptor 9-like [Exaiptasia diaphana]|uniref:G-protein coupled receptors family 1 profile domain-containing protein n=1 Tax=Exaiptasia diaphana TaxID=2652724 RepID=A0A913XMF4_EXADI|nr:trace amine-associated receptor 9-like [Exaiptasia diaphana]